MALRKTQKSLKESLMVLSIGARSTRGLINQEEIQDQANTKWKC